MILKKQYFTLFELARRWELSENEILHIAAKGEIVLSVWYRGYFTSSNDLDIENLEFIEEFLDIDPLDLRDLWESKEEATEIFYGRRRDGSRVRIIDDYFKNFQKSDEGLISIDRVFETIEDPYDRFQLFVDTIVVLQKELERVEAQSGKYPIECEDKTTSPKVERTDIHIIGGLLDIVKNKYACELPIKTNQQIIDVLIELSDLKRLRSWMQQDSSVLKQC